MQRLRYAAIAAATSAHLGVQGVKLEANPTGAPVNLAKTGMFAWEASEVMPLQDTLHEVKRGNMTDDILKEWAAFQGDLLKGLVSGEPLAHSKHPEGSMNQIGKGKGSPELRILVAMGVSNSLVTVQNFEDNMKRLQASRAQDVFDYALFHHDVQDTLWKERTWYRDTNGPIVMKHVGPGCKPHFWDMITPDTALKYDYLWLVDEDLRMDFFSWDLYRTFLLQLEPLVSQPSILPEMPGKKATGVMHVNMRGPEKGKMPLAFETERSEVQAPFISSKLWRAVHERNRNNDKASDWYIDDFWDAAAWASKVECKRPGVMVVNVSPVRHMNFHNLISKNSLDDDRMKCKYGCGEGDVNCKPVTASEAKRIAMDLREGGWCDFSEKGTAEDSTLRKQPVHDAHASLIASAGGRAGYWYWWKHLAEEA